MESFNVLANPNSWFKGWDTESKLSTKKAADRHPYFYLWPTVTLIILLYSSFGKQSCLFNLSEHCSVFLIVSLFLLAVRTCPPSNLQHPSGYAIIGEWVRGWRPAIFSSQYLTLFIVDIPPFVDFSPPDRGIVWWIIICECVLFVMAMLWTFCRATVTSVFW